MIPIQSLKDLIKALPNSYITKPVVKNSWTGNTEPDIVSWIKDKEGERIGCIHWQDSQITIFKEYEYSEEVIQSIGSKKFSESGQHFNPDEDLQIETSEVIKFENNEPELTDYGEQLYSKRTT